MTSKPKAAVEASESASDDASRKDANPHARAKRKTVPPNNSRTTPEAVARWERAHEAVRLRRTGMLWDEIATALGYSSRGAAYQAARRFMKEYPREDAEALRDMEADRLDEAQQALWAGVKRGEVRATEVWIKLSERRSKLLGADKPEKRELTVLSEDAVDHSIRMLKEELERTARTAGVDVPEAAL